MYRKIAARLVYNLIIYALLPFIIFNKWRKSLVIPAYRRGLCANLGYVTPPSEDVIWLHLVSVGETIAAVPIVRRLLAANLSIWITSTTPTGYAQVEKHLGDKVYHSYCPFDAPNIVKRFLQRVKPRLFIIMETELWLNIIYYCNKFNIPVVLINARLSPQSAARYNKFISLTFGMMAGLSSVGVQTRIEKHRFIDLGVSSDVIHVMGNVKYDMEISQQHIQVGHEFKKLWQRRVIIAASTHQGEEEIILSVFKRLLIQDPALLLVLAPRHPVRCNKVEDICKLHQCNFIRYSRQKVAAQTQVLLVDVIGDLNQLYAASDVAFVGGSLVATGGHNILEPVSLEVPTIIGPHYFNFQAIGDAFREQQAVFIASDAKQLYDSFMLLLYDQEIANATIAAASKIMQQSCGAVDKTVSLIMDNLTVNRI